MEFIGTIFVIDFFIDSCNNREQDQVVGMFD